MRNGNIPAKELGMKHPIIFLALAAVCHAQSGERTVTEPPPSYEVKRATKPVTVDGRLDDEAWSIAAPVTLQFPWADQTGAKQKTTVRLLWNDEMLFVAFDCEDADIVAHHEQRDDPTYKDDAVEIFILPNPNHTTYIGLEMNARAVLYDYANAFRQVLLKGYDLKGVQLATQIDGTLNLTSDRDRGWTLELAIPLRNFAEFMGSKPVAPGTIWHVNLNRWDGTEPNRRLSVWSDSAMVRPNPHNPKRFGQLVFGK